MRKGNVQMYSGTVTEGTTRRLRLQRCKTIRTANPHHLIHFSRNQMQNHNFIFLVRKIIFDSLPGGDIGCCYWYDITGGENGLHWLVRSVRPIRPVQPFNTHIRVTSYRVFQGSWTFWVTLYIWYRWTYPETLLAGGSYKLFFLFGVSQAYISGKLPL